MPNDTEVSEVIVTFYAPISASGYGSAADFYIRGYRITTPIATVFNSGPYEFTVLDETDPNSLKRQRTDTAIANLKSRWTNLIGILSAYPRGTLISMGDGVTITVGEYLDKMTSIQTLKITDLPQRPGYAGSATATELTIHEDALIGYALYGAKSLDFYILHEISHLTAPGLSSIEYYRSPYRNSQLDPPNASFAGYQDPNPFFVGQEVTANGIARYAMISLGLGDPKQAFPDGKANMYSFPPG